MLDRNLALGLVIALAGGALGCSDDGGKAKFDAKNSGAAGGTSSAGDAGNSGGSDSVENGGSGNDSKPSKGGSSNNSQGGNGNTSDDADAAAPPDGGDHANNGGSENGNEPAPGAQWSACDGDDDCTDGRECHREFGQDETAQGFCTPACDAGTQTGDAGGFCADALNDPGAVCSNSTGQCARTCEERADCPASDMECNALGRCYYPRDGARVFESCEAQTDCREGLWCSTSTGYCRENCQEDADCSAPSTGSATIACDSQTGACRLHCDDANTCPDGMACLGSGNCGFE